VRPGHPEAARVGRFDGLRAIGCDAGMSSDRSVGVWAVGVACGWLGLAGCGDAGGGDETSASTTSVSGVTVPTTSGTPTDPGSGTGTGATTGAGSESEGASTGTPTTGTGADSSTSEGLKLDVGSVADFGGSVECGCGNTEFSYIWIANSGEGTVTKLNTRTLVEEGRYLTRPDGQGSPSRTSVSIDGRAVAVANRHGGLIKIWARQEDCVESNGMPGIQTSTGKNDVLAWGLDECIAWYNPFEGMSVQRPVAWTSGTLNPVTCDYDDQQIWTITGSGAGPGSCGPNGVFVHLVNGSDGTIANTLTIPEAEINCQGSSLGAYGGAVDNKNDLWFHMWGALQPWHVRFEDFSYEKLPQYGGYGTTTDTNGRVWWGDSPRRYDPETMTFASTIGDLPGAGGAGIAQDLQGRMWTATQGGVGWVDMETMMAGDKVMLPDQSLYRGISVDIDGFIWAIPLGGTKAYKINPDTYEYEFYDGLNSPYSYSDMTGGQLAGVTCNPPPQG
jgi:hypothetical protein